MVWRHCKELPYYPSMFLLWQVWPHKCSVLGKRQPVVATGQERQPEVIHLVSTLNIPVNIKRLSKISGIIRDVHCAILLDSGSSASLISQHLLEQAGLSYNSIASSVNVITASCDKMELRNITTVPLHIGTLSVTHEMYVAPQLVAFVILGTNFLAKFNVCLDYKTQSVTVNGTTVASDVHYVENTTWSKKSCGKTPTTHLLFYQEMKITLKIVSSHISFIQVNLHYLPLLMHTWI